MRFIVGLGQAVALTPGISRSGATIISAIAVGMKQDTALRFSFMLYIPVSLGGVVLGFSDFLDEPNKGDLAIPYLSAFIATLVYDLFCIEVVYGNYEKWETRLFYILLFYCRCFTFNFLLSVINLLTVIEIIGAYIEQNLSYDLQQSGAFLE